MNSLKYSDNFETLIALVTFLALMGDDQDDSLVPSKITQRVGLNQQEVVNTLDSFRSLFRKSEKPSERPDLGSQHWYSLQLRFAKRKYKNGERSEYGPPLSNDELMSLLGFIVNKVREEQETERLLIQEKAASERLSKTNQVTMIGIWFAAIASLLSVIISLLR